MHEVYSDHVLISIGVCGYPRHPATGTVPHDSRPPRCGQAAECRSVALVAAGPGGHMRGGGGGRVCRCCTAGRPGLGFRLRPYRRGRKAGPSPSTPLPNQVTASALRTNRSSRSPLKTPSSSRVHARYVTRYVVSPRTTQLSIRIIPWPSGTLTVGGAAHNQPKTPRNDLRQE